MSACIMTYSLRNTEFSMAHQEPGDLLQYGVISLLDVEPVWIRLLGKTELMAGVLHF